MKRIVLGVAATLGLGMVTAAGVGCGHHQAKMDDLAQPVAEIPAQSFAKRWAVNVRPEKGQRLVQLFESGDYLFAVDSQHLSTVIRKDSGTVVAVHEVRTAGDLLPPFTNGKLFAYPSGTEIFFFNAEGKLVRQIDTKSAVRASGTFSPSTAYIGTSGLNGGRLRAVDVNRPYGTAKWEILTGGTLIASPVYFDQLIFFATEDGHVYAVADADNKANAWSLPKGYFEAGPVITDISVDDAGLYVPSQDSKLTCLDRRTGRIKWQYFAGTALDQPAVPTADMVYQPVHNQGLAAISKTDTSFNRPAKWLSRESTDFLADDGKYAYVRLRGNAIAALDRNTGAVAFRSGRTAMDFFVPNTSKDAAIFAATKDGYVVAITPVTKPGTMGELMFTK